ncbi:MAG: hypothetical protein MJ252_15395 [archaeon]|nr:hypothetical protein [archaeon]
MIGLFQGFPTAKKDESKQKESQDIPMADGTDNNMLEDYYKSKIKELEVKIKEKLLNFMQLQAQRNDLNNQVIKIKGEVSALLRHSDSIGEVVKVLNKENVLVKSDYSDGKMIVKVDKKIKIEDLKPGLRVTLGMGSRINRIIPSKIDPLVSLMLVEKVPDSTYDSVGGLEQQIKEVREVIELPIKHPEIFESVSIIKNNF